MSFRFIFFNLSLRKSRNLALLTLIKICSSSRLSLREISRISFKSSKRYKTNNLPDEIILAQNEVKQAEISVDQVNKKIEKAF